MRVLEDDPEFNAGYGAVLNARRHRRGRRLHHGRRAARRRRRRGAVAAPSGDAGAPLLEDGEHVLLVGEGALVFAREHGIAAESAGDAWSRRARGRASTQPKARRKKRMRTGDTVGACAIDATGHVAAATSTGGIPWKRPGPRRRHAAGRARGTWADDGRRRRVGDRPRRVDHPRAHDAASPIDRLRAGATPDEAARAAVARTGARRRRRRRHPRRRRRAHRPPHVDRRACRGRRSSAARRTAARSRRDRRRPTAARSRHDRPRGAARRAAALASAVAPQELLVRYEIAAPRLAQLLAEAHRPRRAGPRRRRRRRRRAASPGTCTRARSASAATCASSRSLPAPKGRAPAPRSSTPSRPTWRHARATCSCWSRTGTRARAASTRAAATREVGRLPAFVRADTDEIICWKRLP